MYNFMRATRRNGEVIGIIKAYSSFSGEGPFPTELGGKEGELLKGLDHEKEVSKGEANRCGWLDILAIKKFIQQNGVTVLAISNLDVIGKLKQQHICEAYSYHRTIVRTAPDDLTTCHPIYHDFYGSWDMEGCKQRKDIPIRAKYYMRQIEKHAGIPVKYVLLSQKGEKLIRVDLTE